ITQRFRASHRNPAEVRMKPLLMTVAAGLLLGAGVPKGGAGERKADEAAIRALVQQLTDGWNKGDGDACAAVFTEDGDQVTFGGQHLQGRREIAALHRGLLAGPLKGSRLKLEVARLRFPSPDVALAHVTGGVVPAGQSEVPPERNSMTTVVAL